MADDSDQENGEAQNKAASLRKVLMDKANTGVQDQSSENNTNVQTAFSSKMQPSVVKAVGSDEEGEDGHKDGEGFQIKRLKRKVRTLKKTQNYNEDSSVGLNSQPTRPGKAIDSDDQANERRHSKKKKDDDDESFTLEEKVKKMKKKILGKKKGLEGDSALSGDNQSDIEDQVSKESLDFFAQHYLGEEDPAHPLASPLHGDLTGLPPLLIQVGNIEALLDDAVLLDERAKAAGVSSKLEVWDEMIHVWHRYFPMLQEAREANSRIGEFVRDIISSHAAAAE